MKIVISHPHGNQNTSEAIKSLEKANLLDSFWTTIAFPFNLKILSKKFYNINYKKIKLRYFKELFRQLCILFKIFPENWTIKIIYIKKYYLLIK